LLLTANHLPVTYVQRHFVTIATFALHVNKTESVLICLP